MHPLSSLLLPSPLLPRMAACIQVLQQVGVAVCSPVVSGDHVHHQLVDGPHHHRPGPGALRLRLVQEARRQLGLLWTGLLVQADHARAQEVRAHRQPHQELQVSGRGLGLPWQHDQSTCIWRDYLLGVFVVQRKCGLLCCLGGMVDPKMSRSASLHSDHTFCSSLVDHLLALTLSNSRPS